MPQSQDLTLESFAAAGAAEVSQLLLPIQPDDHVQGRVDAAFTLVEYCDYQCEGCGELFRVLKGVQEKLEDKLRVVFRHFPLSGIHPRAQEAAEAAEAAGAQGRFWEMHQRLFEHQNALTTRNLVRYAGELSLDVRRFRAELRERKYEERVREDFRRGIANGVYGTPALFINGVRYNGSWDHEILLARIQNPL
jgi:protein-disulfide isomerase